MYYNCFIQEKNHILASSFYAVHHGNVLLYDSRVDINAYMSS